MDHSDVYYQWFHTSQPECSPNNHIRIVYHTKLSKKGDRLLPEFTWLPCSKEEFTRILQLAEPLRNPILENFVLSRPKVGDRIQALIATNFPKLHINVLTRHISKKSCGVRQMFWEFRLSIRPGRVLKLQCPAVYKAGVKTKLRTNEGFEVQMCIPPGTQPGHEFEIHMEGQHGVIYADEIEMNDPNLDEGEEGKGFPLILAVLILLIVIGLAVGSAVERN